MQVFFCDERISKQLRYLKNDKELALFGDSVLSVYFLFLKGSTIIISTAVLRYVTLELSYIYVLIHGSKLC